MIRPHSVNIIATYDFTNWLYQHLSSGNKVFKLEAKMIHVLWWLISIYANLIYGLETHYAMSSWIFAKLNGSTKWERHQAHLTSCSAGKNSANKPWALVVRCLSLTLQDINEPIKLSGSSSDQLFTRQETKEPNQTEFLGLVCICLPCLVESSSNTKHQCHLLACTNSESGYRSVAIQVTKQLNIEIIYIIIYLLSSWGICGVHITEYTSPWSLALLIRDDALAEERTLRALKTFPWQLLREFVTSGEWSESFIVVR